jgi:hypothetical protein
MPLVPGSAPIANVWNNQGAEKAFGKALPIQERLATEFPTVAAYREELARTHGNL